jgi:hypothetical protein
MAFDPDRCYLPTVYCGKQEKKYPYVEHNNRYYRKGTSHECLQKGFGAASAISSKKGLPADSLQTIKYIGPVFERSFRENNILSTRQLLDFAKKSGVRKIEKLFRSVFVNSNGTFNERSYNSVLLYLYQHGNSKLPQCINIKVS